MLRPLWMDLVQASLAPLGGVLAFVIGTQVRRLPRWLFLVSTTGVVLPVVALVLLGVLGRASPPIEDWLTLLSCRVGGLPAVTCPAGLFLLGVLLGQPGRSTSSTFLLLLAGVALVVLGVESSARLWWRADRLAWSNFPDEGGRLRQSSSLTCGPAAAAMLLHTQDVVQSEGELAYRAGTSLFLGSNLHALADVLKTALQPRGLTALVERRERTQEAASEEPFIAHVDLPGLGGHAVLVERLTPIHAHVIDPRFGERSPMPRADFDALWNGCLIRLRPRQ